MRNFKELNVEELSIEEQTNIDGGFVQAIAVAAAVAGIVYLAGEMAEQAGKAYKNSYL